MKNYAIKFLGLLTLVVLCACKTEKSRINEEDSSTEESSYFGQKPPGLTPELFAPGLVSVNGRFESTISFSPDLKELYFDAKYDNKTLAIGQLTTLTPLT